ncbi:hypothetical protein VTN96DRAFT_1359 [Rasamsonia emersonii]
MRSRGGPPPRRKRHGLHAFASDLRSLVSRCFGPQWPSLWRTTFKVKGQDEYPIERILDQRAQHCLVRFQKTGEELWIPITQLQEDVPDLLRQFQAKRRQQRHQRRT